MALEGFPEFWGVGGFFYGYLHQSGGTGLGNRSSLIDVWSMKQGHLGDDRWKTDGKWNWYQLEREGTWKADGKQEHWDPQQ